MNYRIRGVHKSTLDDVELTIQAATEANARVKAGLRDIVVTEIEKLPELVAPITVEATQPPNVRPDAEVQISQEVPNAHRDAGNAPDDHPLPQPQGSDRPRPWIRFWARVLDNLLLLLTISFTGGFVWGLIDPTSLVEFVQSPLGGLQFTLIALLIAVLLEGFLLATFGNTPGKALLSIRVRKTDGTKLGLRSAWGRTIRMWVAGLAVGIPVVALITQIIAYCRLKDKGRTWWDERCGCVVFHRPIRVLGVSAYLVLLFAAAAVYTVVTAGGTDGIDRFTALMDQGLRERRSQQERENNLSLLSELEQLKQGDPSYADKVSQISENHAAKQRELYKDATGAEATIQSAARAVGESLTAISLEHARAKQAFIDGPFDFANASSITLANLDAQLALVEKWIDCGKRKESFVSAMPTVFEELLADTMPPENIEAAVEGLKKGVQFDILMELRQHDAAASSGMRECLRILKAEWGRWRYSEQQEDVIFDRDSTGMIRSRYDSEATKMVAAIVRIDTLTKQLMNNARDMAGGN